MDNISTASEVEAADGLWSADGRGKNGREDRKSRKDPRQLAPHVRNFVMHEQVEPWTYYQQQL